MAKISIVTGSVLAHNPRTLKEASTLSAAGHEVTVISQVINDELEALDSVVVARANWERVVANDFRPQARTALGHFCNRISKRAAGELVKWFDFQASNAIGNGLKKTLHVAKAQGADLTIVHHELGLWVGRELLRTGHNVGVDFEDWYSRDLPERDRSSRPLRLLADCEECLIKHASHVTTTSRSMADALATEYNAPQPSVLYNVFPLSERDVESRVQDRQDYERVALHWVSQVIGPERGLETLAEALEDLHIAVDVYLRGDVINDWGKGIQRLFENDKGHRLYISPQIDASEVVSRCSQFDIGLALELNKPDNKNLTTSNKMFYYLLSGCAVVASDTKGQAEIASDVPEAVKLYRAGDPASLREALSQLIEDKDSLLKAKHAAHRAGTEKYCWDEQKHVLIESVERALDSRIKVSNHV